MALAQNIRYLRKKQGWGQDALAEKLGYKSYTTIQKWESGVSEPPLKVVHQLAALFNVDINDLTNCRCAGLCCYPYPTARHPGILSICKTLLSDLY